MTSPATPSAPGHPRVVALHRSVRAAVVIPATFSVTLLVIGDLQLATFSVFGCFALLVMADFGGRRPARASRVPRLEADLEPAVSEAAAVATRPRLPLWRGDRAPR